MANQIALLVVTLLLVAIATSTTASLLRRSNGDQSRRKGYRVTRQLFTGRYALTKSKNINVDQSMDNMAGEVHALLGRMMNPEDEDTGKVSLTQNVNGMNLPQQQPGSSSPCALQGRVSFFSHRVLGINSNSWHANSLELLPGSEDYQEIHDLQGRLKGYKWNGVYQVLVSVDNFSVQVRSQVDVNVCGDHLDFTAYGGVAVSETTIQANIRVQGELSGDLSAAKFDLKSAQVLDQRVHFDCTADLGGLSRKLPLDYDGELRSLVEFFFARKLEEQPVTI